MNSNERKLFNKLTEHNISITILWGLGGEIKDVEINTAEHDAKVRAKVRADAIDEIIAKIDDEYFDGGYGDYHEVEMIARMLEELKEKK